MQHSIPIKWCKKSRTLSGNPEIENLVANVALPPKYWWTIDLTGETALFCGNRKSDVTPIGKRQITIHGRPSNSCRLVEGETSSGQPVTFLAVTKRWEPVAARKNKMSSKADLVTLPYPLHWDTIESDLRQYDKIFRRCSTRLDFAKALGWGSTNPELTDKGLLRPIERVQRLYSTKRESLRRVAFNVLRDQGVGGLYLTRKTWFE